MKKVFLVFFVSLCCGLVTFILWANPAHAQKFPGDGYANPDTFGVSGHGPTLRYKNNGNGTFTDKNTGFMWEIKLAADGSDGGDCDEAAQADRSVHCVNNTYTWTDTDDSDFTDPDGTLFTEFLDTLNNSCRDDETVACASDADCEVSNGGPGGPCGFAGKRDWCIPNVKRLQSIVDYSTFNPASSVPGSTAASVYWSATTFALNTTLAWGVNFNFGFVNDFSKSDFNRARAVRPCQ